MKRYVRLLTLMWLLACSTVAHATRRQEALEAFDLASLRYVSREVSSQGVVAIVLDPTGVSHKVRPGNYLGKRDGRVTAIKPAELMLSELHPDGRGSYYERPTALPLLPLRSAD